MSRKLHVNKLNINTYPQKDSLVDQKNQPGPLPIQRNPLILYVLCNTEWFFVKERTNLAQRLLTCLGCVMSHLFFPYEYMLCTSTVLISIYPCIAESPPPIPEGRKGLG